VDKGNTVIVIEHNLDVIKSSDWIIDMGPEGGHRGGLVLAEGTPEQIAAVPDSHTGAFLQHVLVEVPAQPKKRSVASKKAPAKRAAAKV
jgi:excinuclease ABC subunit A